MRRLTPLAVILFLGCAPTTVHSPAKTLHVIECTPDAAIIHPRGERVTWDQLLNRPNGVLQLLDGIQTNGANHSIVLLARPDSIKFFRTVRREAGRRSISLAVDVADKDQPIVLNAKTGTLHGFDPLLESTSQDTKPVFFECRNNQVFYVDWGDLAGRATNLLNRLAADEDRTRYVMAVDRLEITNEYYRVLPRHLLLGYLALELKRGATGKNIGDLRRRLKTFDSRQQHVFIFVRDDSFSSFRRIREIAKQAGFSINCQLLGTDEPVKIELVPHRILTD